MTDVVLFHHVQGLTDGVREFAERLGAGGRVVHTPDLLDGERPPTIEEGVALVQRLGEDALLRRAGEAIADLGSDLVYAGFSWGGAIAQTFAQTRPGARGALLYETCLPLTGDWAVGPWPAGVPVQVHGMDADPFFALEGDLDSARELVQIVGGDLAQLFLYPGDQHLFTDSSLPGYDAAARDLVIERSRELLARVG